MNTSALGSIIRGRRKDLGITQQTLSVLSGVSVHSVSDIETGHGNPTIETLFRLLDTLGLELVLRIQGVS